VSCLITTGSLPPGSDPDRHGYPPESGPLPTLDVGLGYPAGLTWQAREIPPGTRYADEPAAFIAPGWWVIATDPGDSEDAPALLYVDHAVDHAGALQPEAMARALAAVLNAATRQETAPSA